MKLSRRRFIINSGTLAIATALPSSLIFNSVAKAAAGSPLPQMLVPSDPMFNGAMDTLFPQLRTQSRFKRLLPHSALITNIEDQPVYGYTVQWQGINADGTPETYHRRFLRRPSVQLLNRQTTGADYFLLPGQTALVTPLFILPATVYEEKFFSIFNTGLGRAKLRKYPHKYPLANAFTLRNTGETSLIRVSLASIVYANSISGSGRLRTQTVISYRNQRNAERDQAVSLLRRSTVYGDVDKSALLKNIDLAIDKHSRRALKKHKNYELARVQFANKVRHLASISTIDRVQSVLQKVSALPKTTIV